MQAIGRQPQREPDGTPSHCERHRPEQTTLYRLVQQHAATFFAQAEDAAGADLPQFIKDEFDAFPECGILTHGFLRLHCGACGHDKLVAFSCKRRGFCPSCGARRMAQTAAHLNCGGELKIIAAILEQPVIEKILTHLGLQARAPPRAPARGQALQAA